jgi:succinylglutamate desuccinylase
MHGNEPSGVQALRRVVAALHEHEPHVHGRFLALAGNIAALQTGVRFLEEDLNRIWMPPRISKLRESGPETLEQAEQEDLLRKLDSVLRHGSDHVFFMDLHTTSADGAPFALMGDTLRNRAFAHEIPVPVILGLEEQLSGTITEYVNDAGAVTIGFEAGRHDDPESVDRHEAAIWIALEGCGVLEPSSVPHIARSAQLLSGITKGLASILEVRYRHPVSPEDRFRMKPGYETFHRVNMGETVAMDRHGPVAAPVAGRMLLPLYQDQGDDGFFLARPVRPFWLTISAWLRRLRAERLLRLLPGISADRERAGVLLANPRVARFLTNDVFHLFGFRRCTPEADRLVFRRRMHDFW